jgi:hypothetical protein
LQAPLLRRGDLVTRHQLLRSGQTREQIDQSPIVQKHDPVFGVEPGGRHLKQDKIVKRA